jgi:hypothetical protein
MSVADINAKVAAAVAAIEGGDYATAHARLLAAKALLAATPDVQSSRNASLRWDRNAIDELIAQVGRQISLSTASATNSRGVVRTRITYKRTPPAGADGCA